MGNVRTDRLPGHRGAYEKNRKIILKTEHVCKICGKEVDLSLKYPDPLAPCVDHIIPVNKGGHPSDINNLQLAHWICNRQKSDKLFKKNNVVKEVEINRDLKKSFDWHSYKSSD